MLKKKLELKIGQAALLPTIYVVKSLPRHYSTEYTNLH